MADRMLYPVAGTLDRGLVILSGRWAVATAGAVGAKTCGTGMTLTRTGAGAYTVTLSDKFKQLAAAHVSVNTTDPATQGLAVKLGTYTASAKTFTFTLVDLETPAATDPVDGEIHVTLVLQNAST